MIPPYTYAAGRRAEERQSDTMRDGEHARVMRMAKPVRRGRTDTIAARVGSLLASVRRKLEAGPAPRQPDLRQCPALPCS
jgi:hypothetical protein